MTRSDSLTWTAAAHVAKYSAEQVAAAAQTLDHEPSGDELAALFPDPGDGTSQWKGNLVTTAGLGMVTNLILGLGAQAASGATTTRIGVGDGATGAARTDTDLGAAAGSTHRYFQPVTSVAQSTTTYTNDTMTFIATFASGNGNFAWNEWGIDVSAATVSGGTTVGTTLLNHATSANLGTKASGAAWTLTVTVSLS